MKNNWGVGGNVMLVRTKFQESQCLLRTQCLIHILLPPTVYCLLNILPTQTEETRSEIPVTDIIRVITLFCIRTTYTELQTSNKMTSQGQSHTSMPGISLFVYKVHNLSPKDEIPPNFLNIVQNITKYFRLFHHILFDESVWTLTCGRLE
jgi:hypothetical protein